MEYLDYLGVTPLDQDRGPSTYNFPIKCNPSAVSIWVLALSDLVLSTDPKEAWAAALEKYVNLCNAKGIFPFRESSTGNKELLAHLTQCRNELVKLFTEVQHPFMDEYTILSIDRTASIEAKGFQLKVVALFRFPDPTFDRHLQNLGFIELGTKFIKQLGPHVFVSFWEDDRMYRWYVSYTIQGCQIPEHVNNLPNKQQLEKFLVSDLWFGLTKEARPNHRGPRFI